jgi:iron(III) transport system permease protein
VFRYGATGIRTTIALMQQLDRSLEEASQGLGASSGATFRRVTLPLVLPAFFAGLGVMFIRSMTAISATIFVVSIGWTLVTVKILENLTELELGVASAFSVVVVVIVFIGIFAIGRILRLLRAAGPRPVTGLLAT